MVIHHLQVMGSHPPSSSIGERWHGGSALQLASSNGSVEMVRMLLEATSDPNMAPWRRREFC